MNSIKYMLLGIAILLVVVILMLMGVNSMALFVGMVLGIFVVVIGFKMSDKDGE